MSEYDMGDPYHNMQVSRVAPDGPVPCLMHRRRIMEKTITYIGMDVHKNDISVEVLLGWRR